MPARNSYTTAILVLNSLQDLVAGFASVPLVKRQFKAKGRCLGERVERERKECKRKLFSVWDFGFERQGFIWVLGREWRRGL